MGFHLGLRSQLTPACKGESHSRQLDVRVVASCWFVMAALRRALILLALATQQRQARERSASRRRTNGPVPDQGGSGSGRTALFEQIRLGDLLRTRGTSNGWSGGPKASHLCPGDGGDYLHLAQQVFSARG